MYPLNVNKRTLGVTFLPDRQAQIVLWSPSADQVDLKINGQSVLPLQQEELGYWQTKTDQLRPGDSYTFVLNNEKEYPDPASLSQPQGVYDASQAIDTSLFYWDDQCWVNPALEDYLLYEVHTGTFTPEGTFASLETKLDYLKALGVTAIEIMPVAQFADSRNWGYDGVYSFAVQNSYGGASNLQRLVDACHYKGIAVVLDVVYNHFGPEGSFFSNFGPYLTSKYCTPWGNAINFDDAWCDGVRHYVIENALMWFRDFHIDALRLDAVHAMKDCSPVHILQELRQQVDHLMETTGRRHHLLVECDLNDPKFINPLTEHGYGMDAQWIDEFHHSLRVTVGEAKTGYYADFDGLAHLTKSYQHGYVYDGQFSNVRQKLFGCKAESNPGHQFIIFSQNHDQVGNRQQGERSSQLYSYDTLKLLAGAVLVSPYIPLLFMGEEWGETNPFFYFATHFEPDLVEAVQQGRKDEFAHSHSDKEVPAPQSHDTFEEAKLQWGLLAKEPHQTLLRYYQTLIALRRQLPALHKLDRQYVNVTANDDQQTLQLHRWQGDQHIQCLMNFSKQPQIVQLSEASQEQDWHKLLDSADEQWFPQNGISTAPGSLSTDNAIELQPESIVIYAQGHEKSHVNVPNPIAQRLYRGEAEAVG
ncbi:malto-oligosyltrehalose trehalohydrolase [Spirosoma validum]